MTATIKTSDEAEAVLMGMVTSGEMAMLNSRSLGEKAPAWLLANIWLDNARDERAPLLPIVETALAHESDAVQRYFRAAGFVF